MGSRELRRAVVGLRESLEAGFRRTDERLAKLDERFELLLRQASEEHARILEAIRAARA